MNGFTNKIMWMFRIIILAILIYFIMLKDQGAINVVLIAFVTSFFDIVVERVFKTKMSNFLKLSLVIFIFAAQCFGTAFDFYDKFHWWDTMLHTISGTIFFFVGIYLWNILTKNNTIPKTQMLIIVIFGVLFSLSTVVIWEIFEFSVDSILGEDMQVARSGVGREVIMDTMIDMISAVVGTIIGVILVYIPILKKNVILNL